MTEAQKTTKKEYKHPARGTKKQRGMQAKLAKKKKQPRYRIQNADRFRRLSGSWRHPQGIDSDQRQGKRSSGAWPSKSRRTPLAIRGLHPSGFQEVSIANPAQITGLNADTQAVRIESGVGARKRALIIKEADKQKLRVLNP